MKFHPNLENHRTYLKGLICGKEFVINARRQINHLPKFVQSVKQEAFKVTWPSRKDVLVGTAMVIVLATIAAIFFLLLDQIYKVLLDLILAINI